MKTILKIKKSVILWGISLLAFLFLVLFVLNLNSQKSVSLEKRVREYISRKDCAIKSQPSSNIKNEDLLLEKVNCFFAKEDYEASVKGADLLIELHIKNGKKLETEKAKHIKENIVKMQKAVKNETSTQNKDGGQVDDFQPQG